MADEPVREPLTEPVGSPASQPPTDQTAYPAQEPAPDPTGDGTGDRRTLWGLFAIIAVIVILILVFLMLRGCGGASSESDKDTGGKEIVPVTGLLAVPGSVSVWVADGADVSAVLTLAGVSGSNVTNMGGGRFVVTVPNGAEDAAVDRLKAIEGVYDAGRVFTQRSGEGD